MNELMKKFKVISYFYYHSFNTEVRNKLVEWIANGKAQVIELDDRRDNFYRAYHHELNLKEFDTWVTYGECTDINFIYISDEKMNVIVQVWEGDNCNGCRTTVRFIANIEISTEFLNTDSSIAKTINNTFGNYLEEKYIEYEENKKKTWMNKLAKSLLEK